MNTQRRIDYAEIFPARGMWNVRFTSEPNKQRVIELLGTNEIPTPFSAVVPYAEVFATLRAIPANADTCFVEAREV